MVGILLFPIGARPCLLEASWLAPLKAWHSRRPTFGGRRLPQRGRDGGDPRTRRWKRVTVVLLGNSLTGTCEPSRKPPKISDFRVCKQKPAGLSWWCSWRYKLYVALASKERGWDRWVANLDQLSGTIQMATLVLIGRKALFRGGSPSKIEVVGALGTYICIYSCAHDVYMNCIVSLSMVHPQPWQGSLSICVF